MNLELEHESIEILINNNKFTLTNEEVVFIITKDLYLRFDKDNERAREFLQKVINNQKSATTFLESRYFKSCKGVNTFVINITKKLNKIIQARSEQITKKTK